MKVLMISMDKTLLGEKKSGGDAIERHIKYGSFCDELNIIVFSKKYYQKQILANNVFVYSTNSATRYNFFCDAYKTGKQIYKNSPYDLVIGDLMTGLSAWFLKKKFKVKFLMHFHGDFWKNTKGLENKWSNYFLLFFSKFLVKKADGIRAVSSGIKDKLVKFGVDKNKIRVISTPVDLEKFLTFDQARVEEIEQKYISQRTKNILFVGRLEQPKNLEWFLKVFKDIKEKYQDLNFLVVGEGSLKDKLIKMSKKLEIENSVNFIGPVDYNDLVNYFYIANMVVLPSTSESFGNVLVQANVCDKPVVATATTGAKEIIQDGVNGFLVPIGDAQKLAEKILELLNNPELAREMGERGRKMALEKYSDNTDKIIKFWKDLIG